MDLNWFFKENITLKYVFQNFWKTKGLFDSYFQELFSVIENKKHKKLVWGRGCVFLFFVFSVLWKTIFLRIIKRCFHCFFIIQRINCFSCFFFLSYFLCFHKGEFHPTTTPPPTNPFFFLKLLKLIYLHMVTKSSFVEKNYNWCKNFKIESFFFLI